MLLVLGVGRVLVDVIFLDLSVGGRVGDGSVNVEVLRIVVWEAERTESMTAWRASTASIYFARKACWSSSLV